MNNKTCILLIGTLIAMLAISGCSNSDQSESNLPTVAPTGDIKEFTVKSFRCGFEPSTLVVKQGDLVRIIADTVDVPHGLAIPEYDVNMNLDGVSPKSVEFLADKAGKFAMFCSVPCGSGHRSMRGLFVVE